MPYLLKCERKDTRQFEEPKKAVFQTQKDLGGLNYISNKRYIASTQLAMNLSKSICENRENTDPLKVLIERQHQHGKLVILSYGESLLMRFHIQSAFSQTESCIIWLTSVAQEFKNISQYFATTSHST